MTQTYNGGKPAPRDVMNYQTPTGPINRTRGPGIGHVEPGYGMDGETLHDNPGEREFTGSPGNHGKNHGNCGSQGHH